MTQQSFFTRNQYLNKECSHTDYYGQFVNDEILSLVRNRIGVKKLEEAKKIADHFNSIELKQWDKLADIMLSYPFGLSEKLKERNDTLTLSGCVCILKEAARQLTQSVK